MLYNYFLIFSDSYEEVSSAGVAIGILLAPILAIWFVIIYIVAFPFYQVAKWLNRG